MHHLPEIAIIEPNTLTALGLRTILEELIPEAVIRTFSSFEKTAARSIHFEKNILKNRRRRWFSSGNFSGFP